LRLLSTAERAHIRPPGRELAHSGRSIADHPIMLAVLAATVPFFVIGFIGGIVGSFRGTLAVLLLVAIVLAIPVLAGHDQGAAGVCDRGGCEAAWAVPVALAAAFLLPYLGALGLRYRLEHTAAP
jgi:hypothetical protein